VEVERIADPGPRGRARSEADAMLEVPVPTGPRPAPSVPPIVVSAGDDGAFACDVAPGIHRLRAVATDGAAATTVVVAVVAGARREATLDLVPPEARGAITGRVRSLGDRPFAGQVRVARTLRSDARLDGAGATRPGPDGSFRVDGLERGTWRVQAIADDGRRSAPRVVVVPSLEPVDLDVEAGARWVTGRVVAVEDGAPVRGASCRSWRTTPKRVRQATRTDDDGRYRVLVDAVAPNGVVVGAPGRASASVPWTGTDDLGEVRLERLGRVRGRVRRADGGAVPPGAVVWIAPDEVFSRFLGTFEIPTDADGGFDDASVPAGRYVVGSADGFVGEVFEAIRGGPRARYGGRAGGRQAVVDVVVVPAAEVRRTVLDALGTPAVGAVVTAIPSTSIGARGTETPLPYGFAGDGPRAVTGRTGRFACGLVQARRMTSPPSTRPTSTGRRSGSDRGPGRRRRDVDAARARFVVIVVRERATGRPVAGADVEISSPCARRNRTTNSWTPTSWSGSSGPSAVTDDAGRARLRPLGVGTIPLHARRPGGSWMRGGGVSATVADGPNGLSTAIEFDASAPWSGRVVRPDGSSAVGAEVRLEVAAGPSGASERAVRATDDGRFAFDDVVETSGRLSASVRSDDLFAPHRAVVAAGSPHTLRLEAGPLPGFVHVRVLDPDGRPVADASAICSFGDGARGSEFVVAGRAAIDVRDAEAGRGLGGTGTLEVRNASDGRGRRLPVGVARVTGVRTGTVVEVRLPRERTIEGRVVGPDGRGVAGVRVVAVEAAGPDAAWWITSPWMWSVVDGARTDGDGRFRVGRLSDGAHVVAALPPEAWVAAGPATADAGARDVLLALRVADVVTVTVRDAETPRRGATIVAIERRGERTSAGNSCAATTSARPRRRTPTGRRASAVLRPRGSTSWAFVRRRRAPSWSRTWTRTGARGRPAWICSGAVRSPAPSWTRAGCRSRRSSSRVSMRAGCTGVN
jgi:hypothetical protein